MNPLLGVLFLLLLGLLGARISFTDRRRALGPGLILATGTHFVFVGFLLGSTVLGLLTRDLIERLYPFLALGLGWIGLLFGLQLDRRHLRRFPPAYLAATLLQAVVALALFLGAGSLLFRAAGNWSAQTRIGLLIAAATACVSTPSGIALIRHNFLVRGKVSELLLFIASLDALVGIVALQATYALFHPAGPLAMHGAWLAARWLAAALALGVAFGVVFLWLTRPVSEREELVLFLLGLVVFAAGAALYVGVSPLFVCATTGAVIANFSTLRRRVYTLLEAWEKPVYVVLLVLAGALMEFSTWLVVPLCIGYAMTRGAAKLAGGWIAPAVRRLPFDVPKRLGLGLIPQGGISLAMVISATLTYGSALGPEAEAMRTLFSTVVLAVVASELAGPFLTRNLLRRAGEIEPRVEAALAEGRAPTPAEALGKPHGVVGRRARRVRDAARERAARAGGAEAPPPGEEDDGERRAGDRKEQP